MKVASFIVLMLFVSCIGGSSNQSTSSSGSASNQGTDNSGPSTETTNTEVSQQSFVQTELQEIKSNLAADPSYKLSTDEVNLLKESGEFSDEELAQLSQLL